MSQLPSVFVGGLHPSVNELTIRELFSKYGEISNVTMKSGFAFVDFPTKNQILRCLELDGCEFMGKTLGVRPQMSGQNTAKPNLRPASIPLGNLYGSNGVMSTGRDSQWPSLFIGGFGHDVDESTIHALCSNFGTVSAVHMKKGYAFVQFLEPNAAQAACSMDGATFCGRTLGVRIQTEEKIPKKNLSLSQLQTQTALPSMFDTKPTYTSLFIGGLDHSTTPEEIRELASKYGEIHGVAFHRGFAFVSYEHPENTLPAAIAINGTLLHGKQLGAKVSKSTNLVKDHLSPRASVQGVDGSIDPTHRSQLKPGVDVPSVFVGGLQPHVTQRDLQVLFSPYGTLLKITLMKGYAFLDYDSIENAERAIATLDQYIFDGKMIAVRLQTQTSKENTTNSNRFAPY